MSTIPQVTVIVLARNEEEMIVNCLETVQWASQIIVVDDNSLDATAGLAQRAGATVIRNSSKSFAEKRNLALEKIQTDWVLYLDADERVTEKLFLAIKSAIEQKEFLAFEIKRNNIHYGKWLQHGGWESDRVTRLFHKQALKKWSGQIHESPELTEPVGIIDEPIVHLTHRNMVQGLLKSAEWTGIEAELLFHDKHKTVTVKTLFRKFFMEFFRRSVLKKGYKDGVEGWIEAFVQGMNRFIVYQRLWELQRKPSLEDTYRKIDEAIVKQWENAEYLSTKSDRQSEEHA